MELGSKVRRTRGTHERAVFDRCYEPSPNDERNRLNPSTGAGGVSFYRTARDRQQPTSIVTAQILGDPAPDRSAQTIYERRQCFS
jgi:hypothetical protein